MKPLREMTLGEKLATARGGGFTARAVARCPGKDRPHVCMNCPIRVTLREAT